MRGKGKIGRQVISLLIILDKQKSNIDGQDKKKIINKDD